MSITNILWLLAGVGVFIAGMNMLGDGLQKSAGQGLRKLLGKISNNRFAGVGIGATVTAIIQSSSATSVMVIGFVNAGVMSLVQATSIIMGANIGTTVTGILVSLQSLNIDVYASALAFVGVMMSFFNSDKVKKVGSILCGFGLLFIGLDLMGSENALKNAEVQSFFENIFSKINFPLLLILCGAVFTGLIQSSSAATGVVIMMVAEKVLAVDSALYIVLGSNIGTCVTAVLASIGTQVNAKRTALIHLTFNVIGTIIFTAFLWSFGGQRFVDLVLSNIVADLGMQIAWFHVIFNVTTTIILLPFVKLLVKFAIFMIKDKVDDKEVLQLKYIDERLLKTPSVALMQVKREVEYMALVAKENLEKSFEALFNPTEKLCNTIVKNEEIVDFTNKAVTKYLIQLTSLVSANEENTIGAYFHVLNDVERIGDHAENFMDIGVRLQEENIKFSDIAIEQMQEMYNKVFEMFSIAVDIFDSKDYEHLSELTRLEEEVDQLKKKLSSQHFDRLAEGTCKMEHSAFFTSIIAGMERIGDHLINVGYSILNPTGSQKENI